MVAPPIVDDEFRHPCPLLASDEVAQLRANLMRDGCREPLVVWAEHGILLDGHHRREICLGEDIPFETVEVSLPDRDAAKEWIIRNQFGRRNLTPYQRAELALALEPLIRAKAKENQGHGQTAPGQTLPQNSAKASPVDTRKELAKAAGVSHDTIAKAKLVHEQGTPELQEKVRRNEVSINKAHKEVVESIERNGKAKSRPKPAAAAKMTSSAAVKETAARATKPDEVPQTPQNIDPPQTTLEQPVAELADEPSEERIRSLADELNSWLERCTLAEHCEFIHRLFLSHQKRVSADVAMAKTPRAKAIRKAQSAESELFTLHALLRRSSKTASAGAGRSLAD